MSKRWTPAAVGVLALAALLMTKQHNYVLFHSLAEAFSVVVACGVFMVAWNARRYSENNYLFFIGIASLFVGGMDLLHALAYKGMGVFPDATSDLPTQLWIAARYVQAASFLIAPFWLQRKLNAGRVLLAFGGVVSLLLLAIFQWRIFPSCLVEPHGLTPFKVVSEWIISAAFAGGAAFLVRKRDAFDPDVLRLLLWALGVTVASELAFTLYRDPYGPANQAGHVLKVVAFGLIYVAIIETGFKRPYDLLFRDLQRSRDGLEAANVELQAQSDELMAQQASLEDLSQELVAANAAKDQFLAVLSHELRNPLSAILAGVDVLRRTTPEGSGTRALAIVERSTRLQARLVNDLLDLSRVTRGKTQLQRAPVALDAVARAAAQDQQGEAEKAGLRLRVDAEPGLWVLGDLDRLQQVVLNLLSNAIKFAPAGGEVRVGVWECESAGEGEKEGTGDGGRREETHAGAGRPHSHTPTPPHSHTSPPRRARLVVEDTGIGIDSALLEHLFDMFKQGEIAGRRQQGLGIGLSLVKSFVEMHGGRVWAESEGAGKGSRFIVELPLVDAPAGAQPRAVAAGRRERVRVLVVEDNADTRTLLAEGLSGLGYQVYAAPDAEGALELLRSGGTDVILSDIGLPGMDGYEFLRRARSLPGSADAAAFAVTGYGSDEDVRRALAAGYSGHFVKPVDLRALDRRIREWLQAAPAVS